MAGRLRHTGGLLAPLIALQWRDSTGLAPPRYTHHVHRPSSSSFEPSPTLMARGAGQSDRRRAPPAFYDDDDFFHDDGGGAADDEYYTQRERQSAAIECPHFGTCPGCVRDNNVADIDVIDSAKLYFASRSVQKHILPASRRSGDLFGDDGDFFQVRIPSPVTQWRTQAKLAVAPASTWSRAAGCKVGLYQRNSHDVLSIPDCKVHHPSINAAVEALVKATQQVRTPAYDEDSGEGLLRYVQCQVELSTGKVCLSLVMNAEKFKETQPHLSRLTKELKKTDPELWHSIWCHCNDSRGNAIFARDATRWHPVDGPPYLREGIPGSDPEKREGLLYFSPHVFRQGNLEGFGEIAREVREAIPEGSAVCELYAGVGLLGLSALLHHGKLAEREGSDGVGLKWLRCSDENPENARCFERAANSMPKELTGRTPKKFQKDGGKKKGRRRRGGGRGKQESDGEVSIKDLMDSMMAEDGTAPPEDDPEERVTYMQANAAAALYRGQGLGADVIIVDPPRKGLDEAVLQQLSRPRNKNQPYAEKPNMLSHLPRHTVNWTNDARTLIYVSCGFDALARDLDGLLTSGAGWKLESATGYVLFPGSNHVETVVVLRRDCDGVGTEGVRRLFILCLVLLCLVPPRRSSGMALHEARLEALGFCGADDSVNPRHLALIAQSYPLVEWGILFRPDKEGTPRYASEEWVTRLSHILKAGEAPDRPPVRLAAHLCGSHVNELLCSSFEPNHAEAIDAFLVQLKEWGFRRVQVNATAVNGVLTGRLGEECTLQSFLRTTAAHTGLEFIVQRNDETRPMWNSLLKMDKLHENVVFLHDESKGTGKEVTGALTADPQFVAASRRTVGFAGGIKPTNVRAMAKKALEASVASRASNFWIDMESGVRSTVVDSSGRAEDIFDLAKCYNCIDIICEAGLMQHPAGLDG
ncbi:hypothetical protein ACHAXT_008218 [Thalassiosira profunda]